MRASWALSIGAAAVAAVACGGTSSGTSFDGDGGDGGPGSGGAQSGSGGSGNGSGGGTSSGGSGGGSASGGGTASGGASGSGGSAPDGGDPCMAAPGSGQTAICLTLTPEQITAESDPSFDEHGLLVVQVFNTAHPPKNNADAIALANEQFTLPGPIGSLDAPMRIRLEGAFPATAYVRALFLDGTAAPAGSVGAGLWVGGINVSDGLQENEPVLPVTLQLGQANPLDMTLSALRQLKVTVHTSATPIGDGKGPLAAIVVNAQDPTTKPPLFGIAQEACADVSSDVVLTGAVVGTGPFWITGIFRDIPGPGDLPPGSIAAVTVSQSSVTIPKQLDIPAGAYTVSTSIDLSYLVPYPTDAGAVPPNACADFAGPLDGGADGAP